MTTSARSAEDVPTAALDLTPASRPYRKQLTMRLRTLVLATLAILVGSYVWFIAITVLANRAACHLLNCAP